MPGNPLISVVTPTRNRVDRLARLRDGLAEQTVGPEAFEWIVVDDASDDATASLVEDAAATSAFEVRGVRNDAARGPGAARNAGVALARAPLVAFIDDDCVPTPGWLEAHLGAANEDDFVLQGPAAPDPSELDLLGPFSRSLWIDHAGPPFETANIVYPRALFERLGGFESETFRLTGEDMDLALRAIAAGARSEWAPDALVHHAVVRLGPLGKLRNAARWTETMAVYKRHPSMRSELQFGVFWKGSHYLLFRALIAAAMPARIGRVRLRPLRRWLAAAYFWHLITRGRDEGGGLLAAPFYVVHDVVEIAAVARGAIRYRTLVL